MDSRAQFEEWCRSAGFDISRSNDGDYNDFATDTAWQAWQESRAAIEVELPAYRDATTHGFSAFNDALDICETEMRKHGISIKGEA